MRIDVVTIFPEMLSGLLAHGIVRRAVERGICTIAIHDLREFTSDRHRTVDDAPFGGGGGMVMKVEPFLDAVEKLEAERPASRSSRVILLSPQGRRLDQALVESLAREERLLLLCGRYEGVDARLAQLLPCEELSIGDYVLSGGELAAGIVVDAVVRLLPGALGCEQSSQEDSFTTGLLDYPHYTRPAELRGASVPDVLVSGDHAKVRRFRRKEALRATLARRPDLLLAAALDREALKLLAELRAENRTTPPPRRDPSPEP